MSTRSFTLIELIVIILVIGILTAFVISSLSPARDSANDAKRKIDISTPYTSLAYQDLMDLEARAVLV